MNDTRKTNVDIQDAASYRYDDKLPAGSLMLEELLKASEIHQLFESYYKLIKIPVAIIDLNANVLLSSRWKRICTQYHRVHPTTYSHCIESDTKMALQLKEGQTYTIYSCLNGLTDCASPIVIEGKHVANVFIGQFLTKAPDEARFRRQAEEFGFDVADYIAAIREVPIVDEKDTGIGISEEDKPYIFRSFYTCLQTDGHSSGEFEFGGRGLGLGLAVAKKFLELHGGEIGIKSTSPKGSCFYFTIPL